MRHPLLAFLVLFSLGASAAPQSPTSDDLLMARTRAAYDAPFTRNLAAFDCLVQFDWKQHFAETLGKLPPAAVPIADMLQSIKQRVKVDHTHATVASIPERPDFGAGERAAQLEQVFNAMVSNGLNAWLPSSTNVILPTGKTQYSFERLPSGYKVTMNGQDVAGTLLLSPDLRVTSGVMQRPQSIRFSTDFESGPQGYVLASVTTGQTIDTSVGGEATFAYTYQSIDGEQIPDVVTVTPATTPPWHYSLTDCKVVKFVKIKVQSLPHQ